MNEMSMKLVGIGALLLGLMAFFVVCTRTYDIEIVNFRPPTEIVVVTAYNLETAQTDSSPCETALGKSVNVCELAKTIQICATRKYPLKSTLHLVELNINCYVADRPALKYSDRIDLVMPTKAEAIKFGKQKISVYEEARISEITQGQSMETH